MHVGKLYPFHPIYWATECWFFPNFVPWKLRLSIGVAQPSPWDIINFPQLLYSPAADVSTDCKRINYLFTVDTTGGPEDLLIFSELEDFITGKVAHREMVLSVSGVPTYSAVRRDLIPGGNWNWAAWGECKNLITGDPIASPVVGVRYAKYDEAGSPFPDY